MASLPSGVTYDSLEDRFVADAFALMAKQVGGTATNPDGATLINTLTYNAATGNLSVTATIPAVQTISADGTVRLNGAERFV